MSLSDSRVLGYLALRLALGMTMLIHGINRIVHASAFVKQVSGQFAASWLPRWSVVGFAHTVGPVELVIGLLVFFGLFTRLGLFLGGLWMVILIFGSTLIEQYEIVGLQLTYSLLFATLLYFLELNIIAVDRFTSTSARARLSPLVAFPIPPSAGAG